jgi:cytochrome c553
MFRNLLYLHIVVVTLYLLFFLIKVVILLFTKQETTINFRKRTMWFEMILSVLFLVTGLYLAFTSGEVREGNRFFGKVILIIAVVPIGIVALRKLNKALAIFALLILVYIYGISETHSLTFKKNYDIASYDANTINPAVKIAYGRQVYQTTCVSCHGSDGTLGLSGASDITKINLDGE